MKTLEDQLKWYKESAAHYQDLWADSLKKLQKFADPTGFYKFEIEERLGYDAEKVDLLLEDILNIVKDGDEELLEKVDEVVGNFYDSEGE